MLATIETTAEIGKSLSIKREKQEDEEVVIAHLKFSDAFVPRETMDELFNQPLGWSNYLFGEDGFPHVRAEISLMKFDAEATGVIRGRANEYIKLAGAKVTGVSLMLTEKGANLAAELTWKVAGDEVSDLEPLLGRTCVLTVTIADGGQQDAFRQRAA